MRLATKRIGLAVATLGVVVGTAAQAQAVFRFDENGNGTVNGSPLPGVMAPDPSNGNRQALTYFLPSNLLFVQGDLIVNEPNGTASDVVRFTNASGALTGSGADDRFIFYSTPGGSALADTGLPSNAGTGFVFGTVIEQIVGNTSTFFFQGNGAQYFGTSDAPAAVPEPSTVVSVSIIGLLGLGYAWRRRKANATD
jgi:hypothetical protein